MGCAFAFRVVKIRYLPEVDKRILDEVNDGKYE